MMTKKQKRFVEEFLVDLNATQAAIRAGYSGRTAEAIGYENLRKPQIAEAVEEAISARSERLGRTQDWVLQKLEETYDASFSRGQLSAANRSLELIGKHLGMWRPGVKHTVSATGPIVIKEIRGERERVLNHFAGIADRLKEIGAATEPAQITTVNLRLPELENP
jgi:phage terminase small subunit